MGDCAVVKRTTVSFEDEHHALLARWADKEVRSVPNLIQAIVVSVLRGEAPELPTTLKDAGHDHN